MEKTAELLKSIPIFSELTDYELLQVEAIATLRNYDKKAYVFMEGETREAVFFIKKGTIKTFKLDMNGNEQVISLLQSGDMFPHVGFFDEGPYPATAEVMLKAHLVEIRVEDFHALLTERPVMALKVMKILGQKILGLTQRIQELLSEDVHHRTVHTLLRLATYSDPEEEDVLYINAPITNLDLANIVGTSRETINRILSQFKKEGWIDIQNRRIRLIDVESLKNSLI